MSWLQVIGGKKFCFADPDPSVIEIEDLAMVLARTGRFGNHFRRDVPSYSVAQHSVGVCDLVTDPRLKLAALLHDGHEAYWGFGDVTRPAKRMHPGMQLFLKDFAERVDAAIAQRFGFAASDFAAEEIHWADNTMLATEARDVMDTPPANAEWEALPPPLADTIQPWSIERSYRQFLKRFQLISGI